MNYVGNFVYAILLYCLLVWKVSNDCRHYILYIVTPGIKPDSLATSILKNTLYMCNNKMVF